MRPPVHRTMLALASAVALAAVITALLVASSGRSGSSTPAAPAAAPLSPSASGFDGAALPGGVRAPGFALRDQSGRSVTLAGRRGQVTVLAFLSSGCGATCVLVAQQIRGALDQLARAPSVLLVSIDPRGDTPARVHSFLARASLSGRVSFLSGPRAALAPVWRAYRIPAPSGGAAAVERAATVVLIDAAGRERVQFGVEQLTPEALAHDIARLQGASNGG